MLVSSRVPIFEPSVLVGWALLGALSAAILASLRLRSLWPADALRDL